MVLDHQTQVNVSSLTSTRSLIAAPSRLHLSGAFTLSHKLLYFGPSQIFLEFSQSRRYEISHLEYDTPVPLSRLSKKVRAFPTPVQYFDWWYSIFAPNSIRILTFEKDRLPAISGIIQRHCSPSSQDGYFAGLWKGDIRGALLWQYGYHRQSHHMPAPAGSREDISPSWSWASKTGWAAPAAYSVV